MSLSRVFKSLSRPARKPTTSSSCRRRSWWRVPVVDHCRWRRTASMEMWASSLWISSNHRSRSRPPSRASTNWGKLTPNRKTRRLRRPQQRRKTWRKRKEPKQQRHHGRLKTMWQKRKIHRNETWVEEMIKCMDNFQGIIYIWRIKGKINEITDLTDFQSKSVHSSKIKANKCS